MQARAWRRHGIDAAAFRALTPAELAALDHDYCAEKRAETAFHERLAARICATVANAAPRKKSSPPFREDDFVPGAKQRAEPQSPDALLAKARFLTASINLN